MSSRDKANPLASGKGSYKPSQGRLQSSSGTGGKNAPSSRTAAQSNRTSSSPANKSSNKKTTTLDNKRPQGTKQRASCGVQGQSNVVGGSSSPATRNLQKFTNMQVGETSENNSQNLNEMATTKSFPASNEGEILHERFVEQETDVDVSIGDNNNLEKDVDDENTGLLQPERKIMEHKDLNNGDVTSGLQNVDENSLPPGWEQHSDKTGPYFWHVSTGVIQRTRPSSELPSRRGSSVVVYHDDEEINQAPKTSSDEDDYFESGAALTVDDTSETTFVVYPLGCCEFDETQLMSATSSKAIQKCILRLSNAPVSEETICSWGLSQSQPILMRLFDDHIQFKDLKSQILLRSQPIQTIKTWAVDDNNNFAFVIEEQAMQTDDATTLEDGTKGIAYHETVDYALLSEPVLMCYVFRSVDEDDMMSCKVAAKLNEEINRYKEQMMNRMTKSTRLQQMIEVSSEADVGETIGSDDDGDDLDDLEATNELTMNVKYIGKLAVPRPTGIDVLNVAIDKCLAEATTRAQQQQQQQQMAPEYFLDGQQQMATEWGGSENFSPLLEAKLHVSPSSVIVENVSTGEIIVECRIRYLTFMGISKRDIRWCGFIMQNATNKSFVAHCFECHPTAGHVCEAIQLSCSRMYEKMVKNSRSPPETISIIPTGSKIRNTLAKTLSRIKLNPLR